MPLSPELEERLRSFSLHIAVQKKALEKCEDIVGSPSEWTPVSDLVPVPGGLKGSRLLVLEEFTVLEFCEDSTCWRFVYFFSDQSSRVE